MPTGLTLSATGVISGAPTTAGAFNFSVQATNSKGSDTKALSMTITAAPAITTTTLPAGITGTSYSQTLTATGTAPINWSLASGNLPTGLNLSAAGAISGTPTEAGTFNFTVQATNSAGSDTKTLSIMITQPVTGVSLNKNTLSLFVGGTEQLTATIEPDNATNKSVTWSSSNADVATVSNQGLVTAKTAGTATITVTTNDGTKTANCTVTVNTLVDAQTPNITAHPQPATYTQNATVAALTVTASVTDGGTLSYQWYWNTTNSTTGGTAVGSNSTSYTPPTTTVETRYYYVIVTNTNNSVSGIKTATATSNTAAVTVNVASTDCSSPIASGTTGALTWSLCEDGTLTISGLDAMPDYYYNSPWNTYRNSITFVIVENGVTSIGNYAFDDCTHLTSVTIGNSVTFIGEGAFNRCIGLTSVTIPNSVTSIGNYTFYGCDNLTSVTIPNSVTSIGDQAFFNCSSLTSVTIGNSVTSIGNAAFFYCTGLMSVTIPNSVTSIGEHAFYGCTGLTTVNYNAANCTIMGSHSRPVFQLCSNLTSVYIGNEVNTIPASAFYNCSGLVSVTIPNSVSSIGAYAFLGCTGLMTVTIPNSLTSIGDGAFFGCTGLTAIDVDENNIAYSSESGVLFNKNKTIIIHYPTNKSGEEYVIPSSVTSIGNQAFYGCSGLTSVTIPISVTSIGDGAFIFCTSLIEIINPASVPQRIEEDVFDEVDKKQCTLRVPADAIVYYKIAIGWRDFENIVAIGDLSNAQTPNITSQPQPATYEQNATATALTVTASVTDGGTLSYQWYWNATNSTTGGTVVGSNSTSYTPPTTTAGTRYYYVIVTNTNNSVNGTKTATTTSNMAAVTVNAETIVNAQMPNITVHPQGATYVQNATASALTVSASVTDGGTLSYQWCTMDNYAVIDAISGATGTNYTPTTETIGTTYYLVFVTNTNNNVNGTKTATANSLGAGVTVTQQVTSVEIAEASLARVYPNPTNNEITLEFERTGEYLVAITDMTGKVLMRQTVKGQRVQMDIGNYPAGVYLLTIDDGKRQSIERIVKN